MPTLLDIQRALYRSLVERDDGPASEHIVADELAPEARLGIYRNTFVGSLTNALRLSFPAVHHLVAADFFEGAARVFIEQHPPRSAYLDEYGAEFPEFLERFPPAASLAYLPDVGRLEWAVNRALHTANVAALDVARLSAIDPADHGRVCFTPHPSIGLVQSDYPVDAIWRAVLAEDDRALAAIDLGAGAVCLMVERRDTGVEITRMSQPAWRFMAALCAGWSLEVALDAAAGFDAAASLAGHLAAGRFVDFKLAEQDGAARTLEVSA